MNALATILATPIRFGRWLITHPKAIIGLAILIVALLMLRNCATSSQLAEVEVPKYEEISPTIREAPYVLQTSSRVYYVAEYEKADGCIILTEYYTYDRKEWERKTLPLKISERYYGEVLLSERAK